MTLDETKTVLTPEQVEVTYTLAGVGTRFGATIVDTFIQLIGVAIVASLMWVLQGSALDEYPLPERVAVTWLDGLAILAAFAILWGYFVFWETVWSGQTPGKRLAGIRVMRDGGYPIDFRAAFVRNVVRLADFLPGGYGIGALAVFMSRESKRLGDYAAGTIVVADSRRPAARAGAPSPAPAQYRLLGDPSLVNLRAVSREQFAVVDRFLARRIELPPPVRADLARKIAAPLFPLIGIDPPPGDAYPYEAFLVELAAAYRTRIAR